MHKENGCQKAREREMKTKKNGQAKNGGKEKK